MQDHQSPYEVQPPSRRRLWLGTCAAAAGAVVLLLLVVLPAEYGIDPTGFGGALGLSSLNQPARTIEITDVTGGNESLREVEIPDFGEPVTLPNPGVFQHQEQAPLTRTLTVTIPAEQQTEIKTVLGEGKVIVYSWQVDRGDLYVDFHGHNPEFGDDFWVRYKEQQEGAGNNGSLTAPFAGEHGWYWLNYNTFPVEVTLTVSGYFDDIIDYGIF